MSRTLSCSPPSITGTSSSIPIPIPSASFAERQRLFQLPRSSWADYDHALISPGGGVFERSAKSIPISPEMKRAFDIEADHLTPAELIRQLLTAPVDLLWFGGIGTFVKAASETHAEVGDRANDALRVDGDEIRAKVVGEGANLGVTQRGRVAYRARRRAHRHRCDRQLGRRRHLGSRGQHQDPARSARSRRARSRPRSASRCSPQMTDEVAALVLRDNYLQGEALSVAEARGAVCARPAGCG